MWVGWFGGEGGDYRLEGARREEQTEKMRDNLYV